MPFSLRLKKPYTPVLCNRALKTQVSQISASKALGAKIRRRYLEAIVLCCAWINWFLRYGNGTWFGSRCWRRLQVTGPLDQNLMPDHFLKLGSRRLGKSCRTWAWTEGESHDGCKFDWGGYTKWTLIWRSGPYEKLERKLCRCSSVWGDAEDEAFVLPYFIVWVLQVMFRNLCVVTCIVGHSRSYADNPPNFQ